MSQSNQHPLSTLEILDSTDSSYSSTTEANRHTNRRPTPLAMVQLRRVAVPAPSKNHAATNRPQSASDSSANMFAASPLGADLDESALVDLVDLVDLGAPSPTTSGIQPTLMPANGPSDSAIDRLIAPGSTVTSSMDRNSDVFDLDSNHTIDLDRRNPDDDGFAEQPSNADRYSARTRYEENGEEIYFVTRGGIDQGPYTIAALEKMVEVGTLGSGQVLTRVASNREILAIDHPVLRNRFEANLQPPPSVYKGTNRYASAATGQLSLAQHRIWSTMGWILASTCVYAVVAWILWMRTTS